MKKHLSFFTALTLMLCCSLNTFAQEVLKPKIVEKLQQNVFEVVVEKIQEDPLTYEKELPLDRLPYHIRMDKFDSIGTAFLLTDGYFYTAAHVLNLTQKSQLTKYFIRSSSGETYKIGNVIKFSADRDFVIFEVIDFKKGSAKGLEIDTKAKMNSSVFAVGNAQGEGIVMRNGLLTSSTPERRNGAWNWYRFSAAASPGNSGGPLVTPQGKVIGIVAMKNSSENLNYALPIAEINNIAANKGVINNEYYYHFPNLVTQKFHHELKMEMDLPKPLEEVRDICYEAYRTETAELVKKLTADFKYDGKDNFVSNDPGNELLNTSYDPDFPVILCLNDKGKWVNYKPQNTSNLKLENNGNIEAGSMLGLIMSYLTKPEDISIQDYIKNPKLLMDTLSKIFVMTRNVGSEKIKITSYGEPAFTRTHTDCFGRTWLVSGYHVPFADYGVLNFALPLPDGIFSLTAMMPTTHIYNGVNYDFEFISDFILTGYTGTLKQWKEYLEIPQDVYPRHKVIEKASITTSDKGLTVSLEPFGITCPEKVFKTNDDTEITCGIGLRPADKKVNLELQSMTIATMKNTNDNAAIILTKDYKPNESCHKSIIDAYSEIEAKTIPYNGVPYEQEQKTAIFIPDVHENYLTVFGLVYKGSKLDIIEKNAKILKETLK